MKQVIIIGGGFAGAYAAQHLEKEYMVTLIDEKDYFEFTPSVLRTIVEPSHIKKIQVLHRHYLKRAHIIMGCVKEVREHELTLKNGKKLSFDYLVITSGSRYNLPIKEKDIVTATRAAHLRDCYKQLCEAKKVVIIGGGLVGVELAAEIAEHYSDKEVTIVHSRDKLMQRNHPKTIRYATKFLEKHNVNIIYNERVSERKKGYVLTNKGTKIEDDMVFLCTGIRPNGDFLKKHFPSKVNEKHQIKVNAYLQVVDIPHMFVAGDVTDRQEEKTAQNAEKEAMAIVHNLKAVEKGDVPTEYISHKRPMVISLGKTKGIMECKSFVLTGLLPGLLKSFVEWKTMRSYR